MKTIVVLRFTIFSVFVVIFQQVGFSQGSSSAKEGRTSNDDPWSGELISTYREFFKRDQYENAHDSWWTIFREFPDLSERFYVDGVTMYRYFIEETPEGPDRDARIDTLMLIYDQRMAYFGGEGNILGRKGSDLFRYRSDDKDQVQAAYGMLKESLEIEGSGSRELVMLNSIAAGLILNRAAVIDNNQVLEDYFHVIELLEQKEVKNTRRERTRSSIDDMIQKSGVLSCEGLDLHFGQRFEQKKGDPGFVESMVKAYDFAGCNQSALFLSASERLYELKPGSESAHQLAMLFIGRNDLEKAVRYLQMALVDDKLSDETRAEWFYELSVLCLAKGDHCESISFAREAKAYKNDYGKAYIALGDAYIACRKLLGDEFQQRTAYWVAADMYLAAVGVDPALAEESSQKLAVCAAQYPIIEDIFFRDLHVGNSYQVGGCIQENTTVRSRD